MEGFNYLKEERGGSFQTLQRNKFGLLALFISGDQNQSLVGGNNARERFFAAKRTTTFLKTNFQKS